MTVNRGKDFESKIKEGFEKVPNTSIIRLPDPMAGYAGVKNICDFIVYHNPLQFFIECKSVHGNTMPFTNITDNQWKGLLEQSKIDGVVAGVICWFVDHDRTMFIPIQSLQHYKDMGLKSINVKNLDDVPYIYDIIEVAGRKKRVFFEYDMFAFFNTVNLWLKR